MCVCMCVCISRRVGVYICVRITDAAGLENTASSVTGNSTLLSGSRMISLVAKENSVLPSMTMLYPT